MVLVNSLSARIHENCLEKRSQALRGRNLTRDIQGPVRPCASRPLMVLITGGRFFESHWTPDLCLKKSCGAAAFRITASVCARSRRMNPIFVAGRHKNGTVPFAPPSVPIGSSSVFSSFRSFPSFLVIARHRRQFRQIHRNRQVRFQVPCRRSRSIQRGCPVALRRRQFQFS